MCWRVIVNFIIRCQIAINQASVEYAQKDCIIGSQYLVKPNYHVCERRFWSAIFLAGSSFGLTLMLYYLNSYSQNVFRIVMEDHGRYEEFNYPTLGICEIGAMNDQETLARVEEVLADTLYKEVPFENLNSTDELKNFVHMMAFKNLIEKSLIEKFINYTETLPPNISEILQNYEYKKLIGNITSNCEQFFDHCIWLNVVKFNCCEVFSVVPTTLGKCFLFNSNQTYNHHAAELVQQIEIFEEPYRLHVTFTKAAEFFLLNGKDIPETIDPLPRYKLVERGVTLTLEFNVVPTFTDDSLLYLEPHILSCINSFTNYTDKRIYPFYSYTTCITEKYYDDQMKLCNCTDLRAPYSKAVLCNLTHFLCLENVISASNTELAGLCFPNCDESEYHVQNVYYSESSEPNIFTLDFILLNYPTTHRRRQAIRQSEDEMSAFSGILGLFLGLSVASILEFLYLTCCAFFKYNEEDQTEKAAKIHVGTENTILFQP